MPAVRAVVTTGIYCRPDCSASPRPANVVAYPSGAAAEAAGYRACHRCRPYRVDDPLIVHGPALVCRAVQLVVDGAMDDGDEAALGGRLGVSARHLRRLFHAHLGVTPDGLARSRRAHFARRLLDDTDLPVVDVATAAGFGSVRQLQRAMAETFQATPTELRARRRRSDRLVADGGLALRLGHEPSDWPAMAAFLAARSIPGVEAVDERGVYRRTVTVGGDPGVLELAPGADGALVLTAHLPHWEGLLHVVQRARRLAGLDLDLDAAHADLARDRYLRPLLAARPRLRVPGAWDPFEVAVRAVLGQQVTVAGASTLCGRLVTELGTGVPGLAAFGLGAAFPSAEVVAAAGAARLGRLGLPGRRAVAVAALAEAAAAAAIPFDGDRRELESALVALPGIGPWSAGYVALRLGHADAWPAGDRGLRRAVAALPGRHVVGRTADELAERWRPWRALAAVHLWAAPLATASR